MNNKDSKNVKIPDLYPKWKQYKLIDIAIIKRRSDWKGPLRSELTDNGKILINV